MHAHPCVRLYHARLMRVHVCAAGGEDGEGSGEEEDDDGSEGVGGWRALRLCDRSARDTHTGAQAATAVAAAVVARAAVVAMPQRLPRSQVRACC